MNIEVERVILKGEVVIVHGLVDGIAHVGTGWVAALEKMKPAERLPYYETLLAEAAGRPEEITVARKPRWKQAVYIVSTFGLAATVIVDHLHLW